MLTIVPAYGRDYRFQKEARADFLAGKDFRVSDISSRWNGSYVSVTDLAGSDETVVKIRFASGRKFVTVRVPQPEEVL